jgi:hypothetical protein
LVPFGRYFALLNCLQGNSAYVQKGYESGTRLA